MRPRLAALAIAALMVAGCATTGGRSAYVPNRSNAELRDAHRHSPKVETGTASYYARRLNGGRTASGDLHDEDLLTAAHRTLPFGTKVRVTNLENDRSVVVVINDRGPFVKGRVLDVSRRAARELGFLDRGIARVKIEVRR